MCLVLNGDVKVEFYNKSKIGRKERVFQFWFNTFFVVNQIDNVNMYIEQNVNGASGDETYELTFKKDELDIVNKKDKQNKVFSADFQVRNNYWNTKFCNSIFNLNCLSIPSFA